ncbi:MAG: hypothetical protein KAV00_07080 [Phycisphaerae bacterium]|nr:hypothetical protein [Phycisphaerae bacterium]
MPEIQPETIQQWAREVQNEIERITNDRKPHEAIVPKRHIHWLHAFADTLKLAAGRAGA